MQPLPELAFPRPETFVVARRPAYTPRFGEKAGELKRGLPSVIATVFAELELALQTRGGMPGALSRPDVGTYR